MSSKIKNILIFLGIGLALVVVYFLVFKKAPATPALVSTSLSPVATNTVNPTSTVGKDFLNVLLDVKNIQIDDSIFKDQAFISLNDSSILLVPDGTEGRANPFAPLGSDTFNTNVLPTDNISGTNIINTGTDITNSILLPNVNNIPANSNITPGATNNPTKPGTKN